MAFSVNTNVSAMLALQSFGAARTRLDGITARVSTGLKVANPVDAAADFSIAQGVRSDIMAWDAVARSLGSAQGVLSVTVAAATQISNLLGELRKQTIEYFSTIDPNQQATLQNAVNQTIGEIDTAAQSATYNNANLITTSEPAPATPPTPADQGVTFSFNGPGSNTHALGSTGGTLIVNFTKTTNANKSGTMDLVYNGSVVASLPVSRAAPSGSLIFNYTAAPSTNITVQLSGQNGLQLNYSFVLNFPPPSQTGGGSFQVTSDIRGNTISVQHRSMTSADLGFTSGFLSGDLSGALAQIDAADQTVSANLGYYGAAATQIKAATDTAQTFTDALTRGLGSLVDADLGKESALLSAEKVKQGLVLNALSIANSSTQVVLGLLNPN